MSTKLKITVISSSLAILLFTIIGGLVDVRASSNDGAYRQLSVYSEVLSRIRLEYVEEPNISGVTTGALHGRSRAAIGRGVCERATATSMCVYPMAARKTSAAMPVAVAPVARALRQRRRRGRRGRVRSA